MYDSYMSTPGNTAKLGTAHSNIQTAQRGPSLVGSEPSTPLSQNIIPLCQPGTEQEKSKQWRYRARDKWAREIQSKMPAYFSHNKRVAEITSYMQATKMLIVQTLQQGAILGSLRIGILWTPFFTKRHDQNYNFPTYTINFHLSTLVTKKNWYTLIK